MWRVDLQRSLEVPKSVQDKKAKACESLLIDIAKHFSTIMPPDQDGKALDEECRKIIAAAADLALNIRLSTVHYAFEVAADLSVPGDGVLTESEMQKYEIINADTGLQLRTSSLVFSDKEGRVGEKLCTLRPALVRSGGDGSRGLVLVKEVIIVNFYQKVGKKAMRKQVQKGASKQEVAQGSEMLIDFGEGRDAFV
jgi:hypothetical protein